MATTTNPESLPTKDSVVKKDPQPVVEVPSKKVDLVKEKSSEENSPLEGGDKISSSEMEVDSMSEDVMSPSSET
jgi:hypothetical protein